MKTNTDFELYLYQMELNFEQLNDGMWVIQEEAGHIDNILVVHQAPIVLFRVKLMEIDDVAPDKQGKFFRRLLELNSQLNHGSFALEGNNVVVFDTLQAENLDFNEFEASFDDLTYAVTEFYPELSSYRHVHATQALAQGATEAAPAEERSV